MPRHRLAIIAIACLTACQWSCEAWRRQAKYIPGTYLVAPTPPTPATRPAYPADWELWAMPCQATLVASDRGLAWGAMERVILDMGFRLDWDSPRLGLMVSNAQISPQFFEVWRRDADSRADRTESTLATIRRTIRYETAATEAGLVICPKVLVERQFNPANPYWLAIRRDFAMEENIAHRLELRLGTRAKRATTQPATRP